MAGVVVVGLIAYLAARGEGGGGRRVALAPTTTRADLSDVSIAGVGGVTTSTVPQNVGKVSFAGFVRTPEGEPVPGATVRLEWFRVDPVQRIEVFTDDQGHWEVKDVAGGRWRVRAWRTPEYATSKVEELFLPEEAQRELNLEVRKVEELSVTHDVEPDPPITDHNARLVVVFAERTVDVEGRTITTPIADIPVDLIADPEWEISEGEPTETTDANGQVTWVLRCTEDGEHELTVSTDFGFKHLTVAACIDITATSTTTTIPPPTTSTKGR
ncbi:MAG: carboxypeptidase regulatory-like domain-containing protein [Actinobacteria bacterium]|nr:carboxypeptidase regulatory-like domain-containing protein [Actinomycetota bacterium]